MKAQKFVFFAIFIVFSRYKENTSCIQKLSTVYFSDIRANFYELHRSKRS